MWQIGLNKEGQVDLRRDAKGRYVAINENIWENRELYTRNITPQSLVATYRFGINMVIHLLTRWEDQVRNVAPAAL
jgi:hypothetical protein